MTRLLRTDSWFPLALAINSRSPHLAHQALYVWCWPSLQLYPLLLPATLGQISIAQVDRRSPTYDGLTHDFVTLQ